jgi:hypothetical protein
MSIRRAPPRPPDDTRERRAPADVGALTRSFADVLRAGPIPVTPLRSPAVRLPAALAVPAAPAVEAYPPRERPVRDGGHADNTWEAMRDYVMRCVLSVQDDNATGSWPYTSREDVWSMPSAGATTIAHELSLAPYAALMILRSYDSNTQYGDPDTFVMRPSYAQTPGRFIMCEDHKNNTPSGQEKTMWYFEIDSLTIDGHFVQYPATPNFISFGVTLRPANTDWDLHKITTPGKEGYAKGYTQDYDYSKNEAGYEKKHAWANLPRPTRVEINHATGADARPKTLGTSRVVVEAGLEWAEELEKLMRPDSASGLARLAGTPDDPATRYPFIPTQKNNLSFWLSRIARGPAAPGAMALSTAIVHGISDAIMRAITEKVSKTWPRDMAEWAVDNMTAQQAAQARAAAAAPVPPRAPPRFHSDAMHDAYVAGGEGQAEPHLGDRDWGPERRRRR